MNEIHYTRKKSNKSNKVNLSQNSVVSYFNKFKATLKQAYKDGKQIEDNPYFNPENMTNHIKWTEGWLKADALENREYIGLGSSNSLHLQ